jgi:hypothetical protein
VEADARQHAERVAGWPADHSACRYPLQRVLEALRAGEATDVQPWMVPPTALGGEPGVPIVHPDDTVTFDVDNGPRLWLEYNGLDDDFGMPPELYDQQPTSTKYRGPR